MATRTLSATVISFCLVLCTLLFPSSSLLSGGSQCGSRWLAEAGLCWKKVPQQVYASGVQAAEEYCHVQGAQLYFSNMIALCVSTRMAGKASLSFRHQGELDLKKRVMGNIGF